jgi:hypothetical protein
MEHVAENHGDRAGPGPRVGLRFLHDNWHHLLEALPLKGVVELKLAVVAARALHLEQVLLGHKDHRHVALINPLAHAVQHVPCTAVTTAR